MSQPARTIPPAASTRPLPLPLSYCIDSGRLRQLRRQHGMSQEKLAWDSGIGLRTLARLECESLPRCRPRTLYRLARVLGADPYALMSQAPQDENDLPSAFSGGTR
jgi:transcriptional regulator with XRE-family HTH domain